MNPTLSCSYEPPVSGDFQRTWNFWKCVGLLAEGVEGVAFEKDGVIYIPMIVALKPGSGDVGRFLDSLSGRCRVMAVTSTRLAMMLVRRGWQYEMQDVEGDGVRTDVWRRC